MRHIRHLPDTCPCPACRVSALRDTWRDDEAPLESGIDDARADLAVDELLIEMGGEA